MVTAVTIFYIIGLCALGSFLGLIGGLILLWKERLARKLSYFFVSFAAGALIGAAFLDLLPEALELNKAIWPAVIASIVLFSITERTLVWHSHHTGHEKFHPKVKTFGTMLIAGDTLHNFIDGVIIAATTLISIPLGIVTAIAVFFHEIPQEVGDFGALLHAGYSGSKVISYSLLSAAATFIGAFAVLGFAEILQKYLPALIAFAAGGFIYIAATDLMPELKHEARKWSQVIIQTVIMLAGIAIIALLGVVLHATNG